jgi:hypothetical protein
MFQSDYEDKNKLKELVSDTFDAAVLDSAATKTAAGTIWIEDYISKLTDEEKQNLKRRPTSSVYKFGDGAKVSASYAITIPATIGKRNVTIDIDILDKDIPCLLSRDSMKQVNTQLDFKNDEAIMLDQKIPLFTSRSGHYCIPLTEKKKLITNHSLDQNKNPTNINLVITNKDLSVSQIAKKLHSQFSHPSANKLVSLAKSASLPNEKELCQEIRKISNDCGVCKEYRKAPRRPIVGLPLAHHFNECVQLDLKFFDKKILLHMIDHATRLSSCAILKSKTAEEVLNGIMRFWISLYGSPQKLLSDNGGEFSNYIIREMAEKFNITIKTTAAESPWSNGVTERHNATIAEMITKTMAETGCSFPIAVAWGINAKNSLQNVNGYSPYQLVYGRNPNFPDINNSKPPALSEETENKLLNDNLKAMHTAREAFIKSEASEKIKRALNHNVRSSNDVKYYTGDHVYYKRKDSKCWHGPGVVLGQDGQTVLVKHGGVYVRVHPCRLTLVDQEHNQNNQTEQSLSQKEIPSYPISPIKYQDSSTSEDSFDSDHTSNEEPNQENDMPELQETIQQDGEQDEEHRDEPQPAEAVSETDEEKGNKEPEQKGDEDTEDKILPFAEHDFNNDDREGLILDLSTLRKGMSVRCKLIHDDQWHKVKLVSRASTARGKYKHEYNTIDEEGTKMCIDFQRHASEVHSIKEEIDLLVEDNVPKDETINIMDSSNSEKKRS